jgi:uncharacterized membrane protein
VTRSQRLLAVFFTAAGVLHFLRPAMYEQIVPDYLPAHRELVLASGAAEIGGALGVIAPRTRRLAGLWLAATLVAVFPANLHMALHPDRYPGLSAGLLWGRLVLQPPAIWWALAATRPPRDEARGGRAEP